MSVGLWAPVFLPVGANPITQTDANRGLSSRQTYFTGLVN
jgi:hypothetical protein